MRSHKSIVDIGIGIDLGRVTFGAEPFSVSNRSLKDWTTLSRLGDKPHPEGFALTMTKRVEQATRLGQYTRIMFGPAAFYGAQGRPEIPVDWETVQDARAKGISQDFPIREVGSFVGYIHWDCAEVAQAAKKGGAGQSATSTTARRRQVHSKFGEIRDLFRGRAFPPWLGVDVATMFMYMGDLEEAERILESQMRVSPTARVRLALAETLINKGLLSNCSIARTHSLERALSIMRRLSSDEGRFHTEQAILLEGNLFYLRRSNPFNKVKAYAKYVCSNLGWKHAQHGDLRVLFWHTYLTVLTHGFVRDYATAVGGARCTGESSFLELDDELRDDVVQTLQKVAGGRETEVTSFVRGVFSLCSREKLRTTIRHMFCHHGVDLDDLDSLDRRVREYDLRFPNENFNVNVLQGGALFFGVLLPFVTQGDSPKHQERLRERALVYVEQIRRRLERCAGSNVYYTNIQPWFSEPLVLPKRTRIAKGSRLQQADGLLQLVGAEAFAWFNEKLATLLEPDSNLPRLNTCWLPSPVRSDENRYDQ